MKYIVGFVILALVAGCSQQTSPEKASSAEAAGPTARRSAVVSVRDPESGMCSLAVSGILRKTARSFRFISLWKYDPERKHWSQVKKNLRRSTRITPLGKNDVVDPAGRRILIDLTDETGLFWAWYEEDGRREGTLVYSGSVLPNDLLIGPPKEGFIISGIPSEAGSTVDYVPDPRVNCK